MVKVTEIAWAAGFYDGEGCTSFAPSTRVAKMAVCQTDLAVLERFRAAVGGGSIYTISNEGNLLAKKQRWLWCVQRRAEVRRVFALLEQYLSEPKLVQARAALARLEEAEKV